MSHVGKTNAGVHADAWIRTEEEDAFCFCAIFFGGVYTHPKRVGDCGSKIIQR